MASRESIEFSILIQEAESRWQTYPAGDLGIFEEFTNQQLVAWLGKDYLIKCRSGSLRKNISDVGQLVIKHKAVRQDGSPVAEGEAVENYVNIVTLKWGEKPWSLQIIQDENIGSRRLRLVTITNPEASVSFIPVESA